MNKIIRAWVILMILFTSAAFAEKIEVNFRNCQPTTKLVGLLENRFGLYDTDIANLQSGDNLGTGNVYYVDSGVGSDTYDGTEPEWALATLDAAMAKCTANNGDRIYIIQSHGENEAVAAGTNFDVAGVIIVGLGEGDDMPEISLTAVGSTIQFAAADVTLKHVRILGNFTNGVTKAVNVLDAGDGYRIIDCEFKETSNTKELLIMVNVAADADRGLIYGCRFLGEAGGTDSSAVFFAGGSDKTIIANNDFIGDWSGYVIDGTTAASTEIMVYGNYVYNADTTAGKTLAFHASTTGGLISNQCYGNGTSFALVGDAMFVSPDNVCMSTENVETRNYESMFGAYTGDGGTDAGDSIYADMAFMERSIAKTATAATDDLFLVANAPIEITGFYGVVITAIGATSSTCEIECDVTAGTAYDLDFSTAVDLASATEGASIMFVSDNSETETAESVLILDSGFSANGFGRWFCQPGMIEQKMSAQDNTGAIIWYMTYRPMIATSGVTATVTAQ